MTSIQGQEAPEASAGTSQLWAMTRAGAAVAPAMAGANLLQYGLQLTASRTLGPGAFGGFGALLGIGVVGSVPMLALQTVAARHVALLRDDPDTRRGEVARLLESALRLAAAICVGGVLLAPGVSGFLHVPLWSAVFLGLSLGPLAVAGTAQGVLLGRERFGALAALFVGVSGLRVLGGVLALSLSPGLSFALFGTAVGATLAAGLGIAAIHREYGTDALVRPAPVGYSRELRHAASGVLALLALGGVDLVLARHLLPARESGRYAVGGLVARACFWGPQFVALLAVPRMSTGAVPVLRRALLLVTGIGAVEAGAAAITPSPLVTLAFGADYRNVAPVLVLFAAEGALLAVLQLLLQASIARAASWVAGYAWTAVATEVVLALTFRPHLAGLVVLSLAMIGLTTAACLARAGQSIRS